MVTSVTEWDQQAVFLCSTRRRQPAPAFQQRAYQLAVLIDAPAKDDRLYRRPLHILRQCAAEVAHAAGLLQQTPLRRGCIRRVPATYFHRSAASITATAWRGNVNGHDTTWQTIF